MFEYIERIGFKEAFLRIYHGEDIMQKHMVLFLLAGIPAMLSNSLRLISKHPVIPLWQFWLSILGLIFILVISIYMGGYLYGVMHNSFSEDLKTPLLPKLDCSWFKIFFKGFPIQFVWAVYLALIFAVILLISAVIGALTPLSTRLVSVIAFSIGFLITNIFILSLPFVFAQFAENYNRKGLYNPLLPIKYMCKAFKSFILLLLTFLPIFVLVAMIGFSGTYNNVFAFILTALWAYLWLIMQYSANYCFIQIYKNEIKR